MNNISYMNVMCVMRVSITYVIQYFINEALVYIHYVICHNFVSYIHALNEWLLMLKMQNKVLIFNIMFLELNNH